MKNGLAYCWLKLLNCTRGFLAAVLLQPLEKILINSKSLTEEYQDVILTWFALWLLTNKIQKSRILLL